MTRARDLHERKFSAKGEAREREAGVARVRSVSRDSSGKIRSPGPRAVQISRRSGLDEENPPRGDLGLSLIILR